ncbi:MAG: hypothetical protein JSW51_14845 [Gemmatimonadota bacterium]|nr:MAG: hypothetical protein JSW51_14845 [Gemmatimonadota bacterium]
MRGKLRGAPPAPVCLLIASLPLSSASAQVEEQRLTEPSATYPHEFSAIRGLLELPDGRLLIADGLGQALMIVDVTAGTADTIGRTGQGPEEYRQPDGLYWLPGGSILLVDLGNGRLVELGPDLSFGETMPLSQGDPTRGLGMSFRIPQDVDGEGRVYYQGRGNMRPGGPLPDSGTVLRWDRASGAVDTLASVKLQQMNRTTSGGPSNQNVSISPVPLSPQDGWAVAPDGGVAVVRSSPYRVDWIRPDGQLVMGPANEYRPTRIRTADKVAYLEDRQRNAMSISVSVNNGRRNMAFSRGGGGGGGEPDPDAYEWPDVMPAFDASGIEVAPDGTAWVKRRLGADVPPTFDVFDEEGRLNRRVIFLEGRELVGFGDGVVYLVRRDEFDLQWLEVYSLD